MKYKGCINGQDTELSIETEGLRTGVQYIDFSDVAGLRPINHRVYIDLMNKETHEVSMLGRSYDGFFEELTASFNQRSLDALFVEEEQVMLCEGEYVMPGEAGRGRLALYPDAICILPQTNRALRIPLCFTQALRLEGYHLHILMDTGLQYTIGKMGYDTKPFAERAQILRERTTKNRQAASRKLPLHEPFTCCGLFRTRDPDHYWNAAFGRNVPEDTNVCAVELYTDEDTATYLYQFKENPEVFRQQLARAMEAVGIHREIIYMNDEQLQDRPLYRMAIDRSTAVQFLRARSAGRLIHSSSHATKLKEFLGQSSCKDKE